MKPKSEEKNPASNCSCEIYNVLTNVKNYHPAHAHDALSQCEPRLLQGIGTPAEIKEYEVLRTKINGLLTRIVTGG